MALDLRRVERIHARLLVRYGSRWMSMYAGIDPELVKADWAHALDGMSDAGIAYALDNLPDEFPPTVQQFRKLGQTRPVYDKTPALTYRRGTKPPPEVVARWRELGWIRAEKQ